jgi:DnaK suppressor protein
MTGPRKRLEEVCDDLDRAIAVLQSESPEPVAGTGYPQDSADAGSILSEVERAEAILQSARSQREEVLAALSRIDEDSYGQCVDCGREIPEGSLDAARCVGCQAKWAGRSRRGNRLPGREALGCCPGRSARSCCSTAKSADRSPD